MSSYLFQLCRLCSGILDVRKVLKHKVKLGLGTGGNRTHLRHPCSFIFLFSVSINVNHEKAGTWKLRAHAVVHLGSFFLPCGHCTVSDVAGGYSASMLDAVRKTLDLSKILTIQDPEYNTLTFEEVFRLATLGGSQGWGTISKHYTVTLFFLFIFFILFFLHFNTSITTLDKISQF